MQIFVKFLKWPLGITIFDIDLLSLVRHWNYFLHFAIKPKIDCLEFIQAKLVVDRRRV